MTTSAGWIFEAQFSQYASMPEMPMPGNAPLMTSNFPSRPNSAPNCAGNSLLSDSSMPKVPHVPSTKIRVVCGAARGRSPARGSRARSVSSVYSGRWAGRGRHTRLAHDHVAVERRIGPKVFAVVDPILEAGAHLGGNVKYREKGQAVKRFANVLLSCCSSLSNALQSARFRRSAMRENRKLFWRHRPVCLLNQTGPTRAISVIRSR